MAQNASTLHRHMESSQKKCPDSECEPREETLQLEASTVHTSPFCGTESKRLGSTRRKYVKFAKSLSQNLYLLLNQA